MTVYSFACSTPDDWSSWHIWVRTFGPGIITACVTSSIASAAYIVARTQREIAANKYDLDLFDKRYPLFEKINDAAEKIEKYDTGKECIVENIQSLDTYEKIISHRNQCIIYVERIRNFNTEVIKNVYDEINKSVRLYRNITPEKVSILKNKIELLNKNKTYEYKGIEYTFCGTVDACLEFYLEDMQNNIIQSLRDNILEGFENKIREHENYIHCIENKIEPYNNYGDEEIKNYVKKHKDIILSKTRDKNIFIENEIYFNDKYNEFISYISESFKTMNEIQSCIIFIRDEMNKHLNVSDVSYKK
ncbi:hypothetical protein LOC54_11190 [Acetobacter sp. AN02]|uniref:hypothetical protein n=1 Tax=Acetobacter sp. AN02 TaxID=2894186 RepID=UPI002434136F|nr:hypothetical protein [Acetobacter sp. AN02]MDG6095643.1 hypothetical protein [Acetobacter sp. AN02]